MKAPTQAFVQALLLTLAASPAFAKNVTYVLAIGNNAPPAHSDGTALAPLRYADDDAAGFHEWANTFATESRLLSVLDTETQQRYPGLASHSAPPTLGQLHAAVDRFRALIAQAHAAGDTTNFIFYMSSHGSLAAPDRPASLALLDGDLTQDVLYNDVLGQLPADHVHLLVDACHAEAVIRPRGGGDASDVSATVVDLLAEDTRKWLESNTLARFPNVGAIIATASDEESHEWSVYQGGVFTHQLLSGLRGAADVNGDRRIEYSEMHAFLGAANRAIDDARARLHVVTRPPPSDLRLPLADLSEAHNVGWLVDLSSSLQRFFIEDSRGVRYVDAHIEPGVTMRVALPAGNVYYLHTTSAETAVQVQPGHYISMRQLALTPSAVASRDATVSALSRGLFATPFGPAYYRGFVDNAGEISVDFITVALPGEEPHRFSAAARWSPWAVTGASVIAGGVLGGMMYQSYHDYANTTLQVPASNARDMYNKERTGLFVCIGTAAASAIVGMVIQILDHQPRDEGVKPQSEPQPAP